MSITHEVMNAEEFQCRHQEDAHEEVHVSTDIVLTDVNGIPLPLDASIVVEYHDGLRVAVTRLGNVIPERRQRSVPESESDHRSS
jgi:hypothetical protein